MDKISKQQYKKMNERLAEMSQILSELVIVTQTLVKKGIVSYEEIEAERQALLDSRKECVEGSPVQSPEAGNDEGDSGSGES